jgi:hypothetical protein
LEAARPSRAAPLAGAVRRWEAVPPRRGGTARRSRGRATRRSGAAVSGRATPRSVAAVSGAAPLAGAARRWEAVPPRGDGRHGRLGAVPAQAVRPIHNHAAGTARQFMPAPPTRQAARPVRAAPRGQRDAAVWTPHRPTGQGDAAVSRPPTPHERGDRLGAAPPHGDKTTRQSQAAPPHGGKTTRQSQAAPPHGDKTTRQYRHRAVVGRSSPGWAARRQRRAEMGPCRPDGGRAARPA